jgi:hypothetical protein
MDLTGMGDTFADFPRNFMLKTKVALEPQDAEASAIAAAAIAAVATNVAATAAAVAPSAAAAAAQPAADAEGLSVFRQGN